ncbi:hypothetical protein CMO88_04620 [Candidatus Woesearchaeota archaeon]|nr:hypothetical protein [Candidatus Woesearchaeota archaeon]|tara:strand:+ start:9076 stop:9393 length:318 start_codon:yes stop_codon:yes gene_type:complete
MVLEKTVDQVDQPTIAERINELSDLDYPSIRKVNELVGYIRSVMTKASQEELHLLEQGTQTAEGMLDVMLLERGLPRNNQQGLYSDQFEQIKPIWTYLSLAHREI